MTSTFVIFISMTLVLLISTSRVLSVDAERVMAVADEIQAPFFSRNLRSSVIDEQNSAVYIGTNTFLGHVCKYNISFHNFSLVSCIAAPSGTGAFVSAVIDIENNAAYFTTYSSPGQVCKYNISTSNFAFVSCITASPGADFFSGAVIDTENSAAYFGTDTEPGRLCKYTISPADFSLVSCITSPAATGGNYFYAAVIDTQNSVAYFGTNTVPGRVCKYNVASTDFSLVNCIAAPSGAGQFRTAVIDTQNTAAHFGTGGAPGQACTYNISTSGFAFVSCIAAPPGANRFYSAVIDTRNSAVYFGAATNPGQVCKVNISSVNISFVSCITTLPGVNSFYSAVIDTQNSAAYFGSDTNPGQLCKYNVSPTDFSSDSCFAAPPAASSFYSAVIDTQNTAAYFATRTSPGQVCKCNVSSANFSVVSCITGAPSANSFHAAVIDAQNSAAYFGTDTEPGQVCKYNVSSANFSYVSCMIAHYDANNFRSAVIDTQNSAAYFGTSTVPGQVCKFNVTSTNFSFVSCVAGPIGANFFYAAVIDTQNSAAYFGAYTSPAEVCEFNISSENFSLVTCITAPQGANLFRSAVIDTENSAVYFCTYTSPGQVCKFNVSSGNISFVSCVTAPPGANLFYAAVIDTQNSAAYFGTVNLPGRVCKYKVSSADFSFVSCITSPSGTGNFLSAVIDTQNSAAYFGTNTDPGRLVRVDLSAFGCNSDGQLAISMADFSQSNIVKFGGLDRCTVTVSSLTVDEPITFLQTIGSSTVTLRNVTSTSTGSFIHFAPSTPFSSSSTVTLEENLFEGNRLVSTSSDVELSDSSWIFKCNRWVNGYNNAFKEFASQHDADQVISDCLQTHTASHSASLSESSSASPTESIFCFNLNQQRCSDVGPGNCHFCSNRNLCVPREQDCTCALLDESLCSLATACKYCSNVNVCVDDDLDCECYVFGESACKIATSTCRWCPNFNSCLPTQEQCYCSTLGEAACTRLTQNKCTYCSQQEICLPKDEVDQNTCACPTLNSSNCQTSKCSWCDKYQTCSHLPDWDCDCTSLSNTSASSCSADSNSNCKLCQDESVCVDAETVTCRCENFTQSVCDSSSCRWCADLNSCTIPENANCTCNWLRFEDSCNRNSNNKCSWCTTSSDTGEAKHNSPIPNFNYCINNDGNDQCQCSYLSPSLCAAANDPSQNNNLSLSTSCRYCPNADICTHPGNDACDCGNFATEHACSVASLCTWKDPVLTSDGAVKYCSAASVMCSPVMCEGILTKAACDSSGCRWNPQTLLCDSSSACFNFFVSGFTPQPMLLWVIGLLKDVLVVFLVGAYANTFTRPIMKFVTAVKKKVLKQTHIKQQMMEETVYMCDKHCRDDLPISFPQYVERVCESIFELENDDLLDEKNRRVLFDAVAYTLFDNMIWVDIDLLEKKGNGEEINFNKKFGLADNKQNELVQREMKDLTVDQVDVNDDEQSKMKENEIVKSKEAAEVNDRGKRLTTEELLENFTASIISKISKVTAGDTDESDVNTRGQIFGRFIAAATTQYDTYLKTKNVDVLKIKVFLTAQDFDSSVTLTKKVDESLIERASAYVFYDQSRSRKVCAAASANAFPPALSLIYYSVALLFLFISSMISVSLFENFKRMVQSCDEFIPLVSNNVSASNITTTTPDPRSSETVIDGSYLTGAYFLLGFRLLNSSAFSTAILVFVKVVRGIYQRFSGIYTRSLQERIPLMALYSDRFTHVMLFLYALLVLPFALCGPTYGSSFGIYCWVPILIAAAILIGDALVLYVSRRFSSLKNRLLSNEAANDEKQQALSKTFGDLNENFEDFLDSSPSNRRLVSDEKTVAVPCVPATETAEVEKEEKKPEKSELLKENLLSYTPRAGDDEEERESNDNEEFDQLDDEVIEKQSTIESTSPVNLWNALLVFIMTEEIPVIVISLALQLSFNYAALLHYGDAFGLRDDQGLVYKRDYDSRSLNCIVSMFENDVSSFVSGLSSFVPFM